MTQGMNRKEFIVKYNEFKYDGTKNIRLLSVKTGAGKEEKEKKEELIKKTEENIRKISALQEKLYADSKEGIIFVLQARDAAGKDSTIKHIMTGVNPQGIDVYSFKTPSKTELAHDFLWRFYKAIPERGKIAIFNRSHYEDVLVVKVHGLEKTYNIPKRCVKGDYYKKRYRHIVNFEEELYENGYRFIKIFLNVSKEKQKERFMERIETPEKNWKFSTSDLPERELWDDYTKAFEKMINETSTETNPWYVIPADQKWFARFLVSEIFLDTLKSINPKFPAVSEEHKAELERCREALLNEEG